MHIYVLATQVIQHGDPLVSWLWTALVAHFDGSCHRSERTGGAGVIVRKFAGDELRIRSLTVLIPTTLKVLLRTLFRRLLDTSPHTRTCRSVSSSVTIRRF